MLTDSTNPTLLYLEFDGINEGEMTTYLKNVKVSSSFAIFKDSTLEVIENKYWKKSNDWLTWNTELNLEKNKLKLTKHMTSKNRKTKRKIIHCEYTFDQRKYQETMNSFQKTISK